MEKFNIEEAKVIIEIKYNGKWHGLKEVLHKADFQSFKEKFKYPASILLMESAIRLINVLFERRKDETRDKRL